VGVGGGAGGDGWSAGSRARGQARVAGGAGTLEDANGAADGSPSRAVPPPCTRGARLRGTRAPTGCRTLIAAALFFRRSAPRRSAPRRSAPPALRAFVRSKCRPPTRFAAPLRTFCVPNCAAPRDFVIRLYWRVARHRRSRHPRSGHSIASVSPTALRAVGRRPGGPAAAAPLRGAAAGGAASRGAAPPAKPPSRGAAIWVVLHFHASRGAVIHDCVRAAHRAPRGRAPLLRLRRRSRVPRSGHLGGAAERLRRRSCVPRSAVNGPRGMQSHPSVAAARSVLMITRLTRL